MLTRPAERNYVLAYFLAFPDVGDADRRGSGWDWGWEERGDRQIDNVGRESHNTMESVEPADGRRQTGRG